METLAPTIKQRRKFERIETSNINNRDTSSVNHISDVDTIVKLSKCMEEEVQMLADCCKKSIKKFFSPKQHEYRRRHSDPISIRENYPKMNNTFLSVIAATPFVICLIGFFMMYVICIYAAHVEPGVLYISELSVDYPESSIFTLSLNMTVATVILTISMRYLVLHQYLRDYGQERIKESSVNRAFWTGISVALSIEVIAIFPVINLSSKTLHYIGVIVFFVSTITWSITETRIAYYTIDVLCDRRTYYLRFTITMIILTSAFAAVVPGFISWQQFKGENYRNWRPSDGGWIHHVISVIGEWFFVFSANVYVMSCAFEYTSMIFYMPVVKIRYLAVEEKRKFSSRNPDPTNNNRR